MKIRTALVALAFGAFAATAAHAELVVPRPSLKATVSQTIGTTDLTLVYSRPGVKGRTIWGGLVPYDQPWRTGANEATTFTTTADVQVEGQKLAAGTYSFFTIPSKGDWTVVFSKQKEMWGTNEYKPAEDALRVTVKPLAADAEEWMRFSFENLSANTAELHLRWEKLDVPVKLQVDVVGQVLADARREMPLAQTNAWRTPFRAASFCLENSVNLDEGQTWAQQAANLDGNFNTLTLLAKYHQKAGRTKEAVAAAQKAIAAGKASKDNVDTAATEKLVAEWTAKK